MTAINNVYKPFIMNVMLRSCRFMMLLSSMNVIFNNTIILLLIILFINDNHTKIQCFSIQSSSSTISSFVTNHNKNRMKNIIRTTTIWTPPPPISSSFDHYNDRNVFSICHREDYCVPSRSLTRCWLSSSSISTKSSTPPIAGDIATDILLSNGPFNMTSSSSTSENAVTNILPSSTEQLSSIKDTVSTKFGRILDDNTKKLNYQFVHSIKSMLFDILYSGTTLDRYYARFYALETIARMPYFSYLSVLHFYETIGLWREVNILKVHFSQSYNELHHLLIMEELGGNTNYIDRLIAQHIAFFYYWLVVLLYFYNPTHAYHLNQMVEEEAYETYNNFLTNHKSELIKIKPPKIAVQYYTGNDFYLLDNMSYPNQYQQDALSVTNGVAQEQQQHEPQEQLVNHSKQPDDGLPVPRRPSIQTLFDVFVAIRDDELEHVNTMKYLQK